MYLEEQIQEQLRILYRRINEVGEELRAEHRETRARLDEVGEKLAGEHREIRGRLDEAAGELEKLRAYDEAKVSQQHATSQVDRMLTQREVARLMSLHYETVRVMVKSGELGAIKLGRRVRVPETDLKRWIEKNAEPANKPGIFHGPKP